MEIISHNLVYSRVHIKFLHYKFASEELRNGQVLV